MQSRLNRGPRNSILSANIPFEETRPPKQHARNCAEERERRYLSDAPRGLLPTAVWVDGTRWHLDVDDRTLFVDDDLEA